MKKLICLIAVCFLHISCSNAQQQFSKEALTNTLTNLEGKETNLKTILKAHKGKAVVIEVWASWCGDCVKNMPKLKELQAENPKVDFVFLSCDKTVDAWKTGIEKHQLQGDQFLVPDGMKGAFGKSINLDWIPRYIVISKTGKVALYRAIETDHDAVNALLKTL